MRPANGHRHRMTHRSCRGLWRVIAQVAIAIAAILPASRSAAAQELEPRLFSPAPVGLNILVGAFSYSWGNILLDPAIPIEDLRSRLSIITLGYVRTVDVFGASAKVDVVVPLVTGRWRGMLEGRDSSRTVRGFGDPKVRFSVLFSGAPALSGKEFASYRPGTIVGGGLQVWLPLGQYDPTKLLNLGSHRWVFRPQFGVSQTVSRWVLEAMLAGWFYTDNTDFVNGNTLAQHPIVALQGHASYAFRRGFWMAADLGYGRGGRSSINGQETESLLTSWRLGVVLAIPISDHDSIKLGFVSGVRVGSGADYDSILAAYQYRWLSGT